MGEGFGRFSRASALVAVVIAVSMLGTPVLNIGGNSVNVSPVDNVNVAAASGRTFTVGEVDYGGGMATLNPFVYTQAEEFQTIWPVYSTLLMYDIDNKIIGDLANSWTVSPDGKTWDFKIANNAYFVDPFNPTAKTHQVTSLDIQWTYWEINNDTVNHLSSYFNDGYNGVIASMTRPSNYEIIITTTKPYAPFLGALTMIPIVPEYIWAHLPGGKTVMTYGNFPMVGSGPFYSDMTAVPQTVGTLYRNPIWFQEENRGWQLHIDTLQYKTELSHVTAWSELNTNPPTIDVMMGVTPSQYKANIINTTTPYVKGFAQTTGFVFEYQLNQLTPLMRTELVKAGKLQNGGSNNPVISNPTVELALQMCINRQEFIDKAYLGLGGITDSIIPRVNRWYNPEPNPLTFNPTAARQLLMNAGWAYDANGNPATSSTVPLYKKGPVNGTVYHGLSFRLISLLPETYWEIGSRLIVTWAAQAGIQYTRDLLPTNQANGAWYKGDYDAWLWDWFFSPTSDPSTDCLSVHTTGGIGSWSGSYFSNVTFDALYNKSLTAVDEGARRNIVNEMQHLLYQSHMVSYPADRQELYAVSYRNWDVDSYGDWVEHYSLMPDWAMPWLFMQLSPVDNLAPTVTIGASTFDGVVGTPVNFFGSATDSSTLEYQWYYGDGSVSGWKTDAQGGASQPHPYANDGVYTAYLAAREIGSADQFSSVKQAEVTIVNPSNSAPTNAQIGMTPGTGINSGTQVSFTGSATDTDPLYYTWSWGDGEGDIGSAASHQFKTPGVYTVTLNVTDNHPGTGRPAQATKVVSVAANRPPTISLPSSGLVEMKKDTQFNATANDQDLDALRYTWYWGDGSKSVTTAPTATHKYNQKGLRNLVVWADDLTGLTSPSHNVSATEAVTVFGQPTVPSVTSFTVKGLTTGITALTGEVLNFTAIAKDGGGDAMTFEFKFGDGVWYNQTNAETGNNQLVTNWVLHPYMTGGVKTAYIYVYDGQDTSPGTSRIITVTVNDPPQVTPLTDKTGNNGTAIAVTGAAYDPDGDPMRFTWDFGDGTPLVVAQSTTHTYAKPGTYTYRLYVWDQRDLIGHNVSSSASVNVRFKLVIGAGWNLVNVPVIGNSFKASTLPGLMMGDSVVPWNSGPGSYGTTYIKGISPPSMDFDLIPAYGVWIYASAGRTLYLNGAIPDSQQVIPLDVTDGGGWIIIGLNSMTGRTASSLAPMITGATLTSVVKWTGTTYVTFIPTIPFMNNFPLEAGKAYWLFLTGDASMTYDP